VSNNTSPYVGGLYAAGTATVSSCTFADNEATTPSDPIGNIFSGAGLTIENTLVAGGIPVNCGIDSGNAYTSNGHNLDTGTTCGFSATGDRTNANADLDVLANYGGPTFTRALLGASDAANAGNTATCPATDQRGVARPIGAACDIGAFEGGCGDGNPDPGEVCDDGNVVNGDGCDNNCTFTACGNDIVTSGEQCDDGNTSNGDCCNSTCQYESSASPCTGTTLCATTCNGAGSCAPAIRNTCRSALKSVLVVKNPPGDSTKDKIVWKWVKGEETMLADFGSPQTTTEYALCLYTGTTAAAVVRVPPSAAFWTPISTKGFKYLDPDRTVNAVGKVLLKQGAAGKAKALLKGKGLALADLPAGPLDLPLTAQLVNSTNAICYEGVYDTGDIIKNEEEKFKAKAQ
jgi:cysteine-rich repeat protein